MAEDTRDIAIESREQGKSAHKRLDGINGQIERLGKSHEKIRTELTAQVGTVRLELVEMREDVTKALYDPDKGLVLQVADLTATVRTALKVAGALVSVLVVVAGGVGVYTLTHLHHPADPPVASQTK